MSKRESMWRNMLDNGGLHEECVPGQAVLELLGENRVLIENHNRIVSYETNRISVDVCYGILSIFGSNLQLRHMSRRKLMIIGSIETIQIQRGNRL